MLVKFGGEEVRSYMQIYDVRAGAPNPRIIQGPPLHLVTNLLGHITLCWKCALIVKPAFQGGGYLRPLPPDVQQEAGVSGYS